MNSAKKAPKASKLPAYKLNDPFNQECSTCGNKNGYSWGLSPIWLGSCGHMIDGSRSAIPGLVDLPGIFLIRNRDILGKEEAVSKMAIHCSKLLMIVADQNDIQRSSQQAPVNQIGIHNLSNSLRSSQVAHSFVLVTPSGWTSLKESSGFAERVKDAIRDKVNRGESMIS